MSELRVTVSFPEGFSTEERSAILDALSDAVESTLGDGASLSRLPGLAQKEGPPRVFVFAFEDAADALRILRALGGWYMRHPAPTVSLRADMPGGGVHLQLKGFSTVALAAALARIGELVEPRDHEPHDHEAPHEHEA